MAEANKNSLPTLNQEDIHLWWDEFQACQPSDTQWSLLDGEEQARAQRFKRACDRDRYVQVRSTLRILIAAYLGVSAAEVKFCYGCKGKPILNDAHHDEGLEFNVSHSRDFALWGFSRRHALGVDVEYIKPDFQASRIAKRFFTAHEFEAFTAQSSIPEHAFFFQLWTRKEACIKARGDSLFEKISQIEVPSHESCLSQWSPLNDGGLSVRDVALHRDYTAAIATVSSNPNLSCFRVNLESIAVKG